MPVIDELVTKFTAQDLLTPALRSMTGSLSNLGAAMPGILSAIAGFGTIVGGSVVGSVLALGSASVSAYADFEVLKMGLNAVSGSAEDAEAAFARLRDIAKGPGLKLSEAVQSYTDLVAAGVDSATAERALTEFGNALVSVGRGAADLQGALYGVRQLITSDIVKAEDLNIIVERVPQAAKILRDFYGTVRGEDLTKKGIGPREALQTILVGLERLPRAAGGVKNAMDNMSDGINIALANSGEAIMKELAEPMKLATDYMTFLADSDVGKRFGENFATMLGFGPGAGAGSVSQNPIIKILTIMTAMLEQLPILLRDLSIAATDYLTGLLTLDLQKMGGAYKKFVDSNVGFGMQVGTRAMSLEAQFKNFIGETPKVQTEQPETIKTTDTRILEAIETNTRPLRDFASMVLGGGELGRVGVTATEIAGLSGRRAPSGVERAVVDLAKALADAIATGNTQGLKAQKVRGL